MKRILGIWAVLCLGGLAGAQLLPVGGPATGFEHILLDLFGRQSDFVATATMHLRDNATNELMTMDCNVDALNGSVYMEMSSFYAGTNASPGAAQLKQMPSVTILRPDLDRTYQVFPMFQSYVETALSRDGGTPVESAPRIGKTLLGKETIDDHACEKTAWSVTDAAGTEQKLLVWTAPDLHNFPIQVSIGVPPNTAVLEFVNVQFDPPLAALFSPPAGFIKYEGISSMIMSNATNVSITGPASK